MRTAEYAPVSSPAPVMEQGPQDGVGVGVGVGDGDGDGDGDGEERKAGGPASNSAAWISQKLLDAIRTSEQGRAKYSFSLAALGQLMTSYKLEPRTSDFPKLAAKANFAKWVEYRRLIDRKADDYGALNLLRMRPQDLIWNLCVEKKCQHIQFKVTVWTDRVWAANKKWYNILLETLGSDNAKLGDEAEKEQAKLHASGEYTRIKDNVHWLWTTVTSKYHSQSRPRRQVLEDKFRALKLFANQDPESFFHQVREINLELGGMAADLGEQLEFTERQIIDRTLDAMPEEYAMTKEMWQADEELTLEKMMGQLKAKWEKRQGKKYEGNKQGIAAVGAKGKKPFVKKGKKKDGGGGVAAVGAKGGGKGKAAAGKKPRPAPHSINAPCNAYAQGDCKYGDTCIFQHGSSSGPSKVQLNVLGVSKCCGTAATSDHSNCYSSLKSVADDDEDSDSDEEPVSVAAAANPFGQLASNQFLLDTGARAHVTNCEELLHKGSIKKIVPVRIVGACGGQGVRCVKQGKVPVSPYLDVNNVLFAPGLQLSVFSVMRFVDSEAPGGGRHYMYADSDIATIRRKRDNTLVASGPRTDAGWVLTVQSDNSYDKVMSKEGFSVHIRDDRKIPKKPGHSGDRTVLDPKGEPTAEARRVLEVERLERTRRGIVEDAEAAMARPASPGPDVEVPVSYPPLSIVPRAPAAASATGGAGNQSNPANFPTQAYKKSGPAMSVQGHVPPTVTQVTKAAQKASKAGPAAIGIHSLAVVLDFEDSDALIPIAMAPVKQGDEVKLKEPHINEWHYRLGHVNGEQLRAANREFRLGIPEEEISDRAIAKCPDCAMGKGRRPYFSHRLSGSYPGHAPHPLFRLVADLSGPMSSRINGRKVRMPTAGGAIYTLVVIDEWSHFQWGYLLKAKHEAAALVIQLFKRLHTEFGVYPSEFHSDDGGEFNNGAINDFCREVGIRADFTSRNTPQHNALAERYNGINMGAVRSDLAHCGAGLALWGECYLYNVHRANRRPLKLRGGKCAYELLYRRAPRDIGDLHVFGCDVYVHVDSFTAKPAKLEPRYIKYVFAGVSANRSGCYRLIHPVSGTLKDSRDIRFLNEKTFTAMKTLNRQLGVRPGESESVIRNPEDNIDDIISEFPDSAPWMADARAPAPLSEDQPGPPPLEKDEQSSSESEVADNGVSQPSVVPSSNGEDILVELQEYDPGPEESLDQVVSQNDDGDIEDDAGSDAGGAVEESKSSNPFADIPPSSLHSLPNPNFARGVASLGERRQGVNANQSDINVFLQAYSRCSSQELDTVVDCVSGVNTIAAITPSGAFEPGNYGQAMRCPEKAKWQEAMEQEGQNMINKKVYRLVKRPVGVKVLGTMWVYKVKIGDDGKPKRYKARLVVRGDRQEHGVNYDETFASVFKSKTLKMVTALVAQYNLNYHQLDFEAAFLNAAVDCPIYVEQPPGLSNGDSSLVWLLDKALYGLKQAPKLWKDELESKLISMGYRPLLSDSAVYIKTSRTGRPIIFPVYVDDVPSANHPDDESEWQADLAVLSKHFSINALGNVDWLLNMKVTRNRELGLITLDQSVYVRNMLVQFGMEECNSVSNPWVTEDLAPVDGKDRLLDESQGTPYRSLVCSLSYAAVMTRLDIASVVARLTRYMSKPYEKHMKAAKHVLRYLSGTVNLGLVFRCNGGTALQVTAYVDADWAGDLEDRKSTSGGLILFNGTPVFWWSRKQNTVAHSSCDAEYVSLSEGAREVIWCQHWLKEVIGCEVTFPILCDSESCIALTKHEVQHRRTKHIDICHHYVRDYVAKGRLAIHWVPTGDQLADVLTKRVATHVFQFMVGQLMCLI
jgi:hypothetical protein